MPSAPRDSPRTRSRRNRSASTSRSFDLVDADAAGLGGGAVAGVGQVFAAGARVDAEPVAEHFDVVADPRPGDGEGVGDLFGGGAVGSGGQVGSAARCSRACVWRSRCRGCGRRPGRAGSAEAGRSPRRTSVTSASRVGVGVLHGGPELGRHPGGEDGEVLGGGGGHLQVVVVVPRQASRWWRSASRLGRGAAARVCSVRRAPASSA